MLVRTEFRSSCAETQTGISEKFAKELVRFGLLMAPVEFFRTRPDWASDRFHRTIMELVKGGYLAWRVIPPEYAGTSHAAAPWPIGAPNRVELVLAEPGEQVPISCDLAQPENFSQSRPVARISDMILGDHGADLLDRSDLWRYMFEPLLDALPVRRRSVTIVDRYLPSHVTRANRHRLGGRGGLNWLLGKINENSIRNHSRTSVLMYAMCDEDTYEQTSLDKLRNSISEALRPHAEIDLRVLVGLMPSEREDWDTYTSLHQRYVIFGSMRGVILDSGLDSLSEPTANDKNPDRERLTESKFRDAFTYRIRLGESKAPLLERLNDHYIDDEWSFGNLGPSSQV